MDVRVVSSPPAINAALAERSSAILVIWKTEIRILQAAPIRMDAGIGKRARLEPGSGKTHAGSEPAPSASKGEMTELANVLAWKAREVKKLTRGRNALSPPRYNIKRKAHTAIN